jgi:hypothetical protein
MKLPILPVAALLAAALMAPTAISAASLVVEAGQTHELAEDLVLDGDDNLEIGGTSAKPCVLVGNRHRIRTGPKWSGSLEISHCLLKELGELPKRNKQGQIKGSGAAALELKATGRASILIERSVLDACSGVQLQIDDESTATFRHNTVLENSVVAISKDIADSGDAFTAGGNSRQPKFFQGNLIPCGKVVIRSPNWLVGGDSNTKDGDLDANLFIGLRIGIAADGAGTVVRGNYFHLLMPINEQYPYWSQISVFTTGPAVVGEHNVIRDGEWIVRFVEGEFRHNVISDIIDHNLLQNGSNGRIHHNLFLAGTSKHRQGSMSAAIAVVYPPKKPGEGIEIFNNVFDGGARLDVPGVEVAPNGYVKSLRNNVFFNFAHRDKYYRRPQGMIRTSWNDETTEEKPARIGYADYNLFFNPSAVAPRNYLLSVSGKTLRKEAGFGLHDVPRGGRIDEQVDPRFQGPLPREFPFSDDEVRTRSVTVSEILAHYRAAYTPAEGSPLIDAGDPSDGPGTNIGAVE